MSKRILLSLMIGAALAGCADPPGLPKPKPLDLAEEQRSTALFQKYGPHVRQVDGVLNTYLTANNNPRTLIVVVKDQKSADAVWNQYASVIEREGLPMRTKIAERNVPDDGSGGAIEAVPTQTVPDTWWGKVVGFFQGWSVPWLPKPSN